MKYLRLLVIIQNKIEEYGLIPGLAYNESTLKEIAVYIYTYSFIRIIEVYWTFR